MVLSSLYRSGGSYEKMVVLLFTDPIKNVSGAKGYLLSKLPKVGGSMHHQHHQFCRPWVYSVNLFIIE